MDKEKNINNKVMFIIALAITLLAVLGTLAIAIIAMIRGYNAEYSDFKEQVGFIAQTLFPIWGTWFGTILAFYFSKENFDAAAKSNEKLNDRLFEKFSERERNLADRQAVKEMKPLAYIKYLCIAEDGKKTLSSLVDEKISRYPILNSKADKKLECIIHSSVIFKYFHRLSGNEKDIKTLNDFVEEMRVKINFEDGVAFIPETATLLDAKNAMLKRNACEDVFVTKDGNKSSEVLGWITNRDISNLEKT
jgi:hypothetical protein